MNLPELTERTVCHFRDNADTFGMNGELVRASHLLNPDDFAHRYFLVTDGDSTLRLKLAKGDEQKTRLRQWQEVQPILEEHYRAPRLLGWVELPGTDYAGLLFKNIEGVRPDFRKPSILLEEVMYVMDNLHNDEELAERLAGAQDRKCLADSFVDTWVRPLQDRLRVVEGKTPFFVSPDDVRWMQEEVANLGTSVRASSEFMRFATMPIHGNLTPRAILVTRDDNWYIVNWSRLALGDPAIDYACLLWPLFTHGGLKAPGQSFPIPSHDPGFARRLALCLRALSLEGVVSVLADHVECETAPADYKDTIQASKRQEYEENLADYRRRFC